MRRIISRSPGRTRTRRSANSRPVSAGFLGYPARAIRVQELSCRTEWPRPPPSDAGFKRTNAASSVNPRKAASLFQAESFGRMAARAQSSFVTLSARRKESSMGSCPPGGQSRCPSIGFSPQAFKRFNLAIQVVLNDKLVPKKIRVIPVFGEAVQKGRSGTCRPAAEIGVGSKEIQPCPVMIGFDPGMRISSGG